MVIIVFNRNAVDSKEKNEKKLIYCINTITVKHLIFLRAF